MDYPEAKNCESCGATVSKYALTCPHCGCNYANRQWRLWMKWIIGVMVVVLIEIGLVALSRHLEWGWQRKITVLAMLGIPPFVFFLLKGKS